MLLIAQHTVDIAIVIFCVTNKKYFGVPGRYCTNHGIATSTVMCRVPVCMYKNKHFRMKMDAVVGVNEVPYSRVKISGSRSK